MTLLHVTEGLWECEKTILGRRVDYCTSFMCRNGGLWGKRSGSRRLFPHVNPPHEFSLVAVLYNARLPNTAIRELSSCHYFEYIIILAALSHPAHHHFSLFSLFWIDKSFMRREHQVTWNTDASVTRFIGSLRFCSCRPTPFHLSRCFQSEISLIAVYTNFTGTKLYSEFHSCFQQGRI